MSSQQENTTTDQETMSSTFTETEPNTTSSSSSSSNGSTTSDTGSNSGDGDGNENESGNNSQTVATLDDGTVKFSLVQDLGDSTLEYNFDENDTPPSADTDDNVAENTTEDVASDQVDSTNHQPVSSDGDEGKEGDDVAESIASDEQGNVTQESEEDLKLVALATLEEELNKRQHELDVREVELEEARKLADSEMLLARDKCVEYDRKEEALASERKEFNTKKQKLLNQVINIRAEVERLQVFEDQVDSKDKEITALAHTVQEQRRKVRTVTGYAVGAGVVAAVSVVASVLSGYFRARPRST